MAKKTKPAKASTPARLYELVIKSTGYEELDGTIVSADENSIVLSHKKPRSRKRVTRVIPSAEVIAYSKNSENEADSDWVVFRSSGVEVATFEIYGDYKIENGFISFKDTDGNTGRVSLQNCSLSSNEEDSPKVKPPKASSKPSKKKGGKVAKAEGGEEWD
jgi:hypothetical protein